MRTIAWPLADRQSRRPTKKERPMGELQRWLRSTAAAVVLDDAVLGCLLDYEVDEICDDFGVTRAEFRAALNTVLGEGF